MSLGSDGPEFLIKSWHPVYRILIANLCIIEAVGCVLLEHGGYSTETEGSILQVTWAMWPLVAMFIIAMFISDLRENVERGSPTCLNIFCWFVGGYFPWMFTGAFGYTAATDSRTIMAFMQIVVFGIASCILFFLRAITKKMRSMDDEEIDKVVKNCFTTIAYSMLPVVYLTLESVGWVLLQSTTSGFGGPRGVVKVNFVACTHVFAIATYQILFAPVNKYR